MENRDFVIKVAAMEKEELENLIAFLTGYYSNEQDYLDFKKVVIKKIEGNGKNEL